MLGFFLFFFCSSLSEVYTVWSVFEGLGAETS